VLRNTWHINSPRRRVTMPPYPRLLPLTLRHVTLRVGHRFGKHVGYCPSPRSAHTRISEKFHRNRDGRQSHTESAPPPPHGDQGLSSVVQRLEGPAPVYRILRRTQRRRRGIDTSQPRTRSPKGFNTDTRKLMSEALKARNQWQLRHT
jgi:hypothetical protein